MRPKDDREEPATSDGPLADFVDDQLNKPLAEQVAEQLEDGGPVRSGATDYARGTTEHEDDRES